ncbi:Lrp/AsnC family transcriptional regulator [Chloroflexi bacterium TSY]|nr:Lrp/AsnC family transcriptional regulator [Chloroflexi bacterium TSY]
MSESEISTKRTTLYNMMDHSHPAVLDALDYEILLELRKDGRARAAQIARVVNANERTVRNRIDRLVDQGIIRVAAIMNPEAFGYTSLVEVFLQVEAAKEDHVVDRLLAMEEIIYLAHGFGEQDLIIHACFRENDAMRSFLRQTLPALQGVHVTRSILVPRVLRTLDAWMPNIEDFHIDSSPKGANGADFPSAGYRQTHVSRK